MNRILENISICNAESVMYNDYIVSTVALVSVLL